MVRPVLLDLVILSDRIHSSWKFGLYQILAHNYVGVTLMLMLLANDEMGGPGPTKWGAFIRQDEMGGLYKSCRSHPDADAAFFSSCKRGNGAHVAWIR
jgi:hypothetical protein